MRKIKMEQKSALQNYLNQVYFMQQAILQIRAQAEYQQQEQLAIQVTYDISGGDPVEGQP